MRSLSGGLTSPAFLCLLFGGWTALLEIFLKRIPLFAYISL